MIRNLHSVVVTKSIRGKLVSIHLNNI